MSLVLEKGPEELKAAFLALKTRRDVAGLLDVPYERLNYHLYISNYARRYTRFPIRKRGGGTREISAPVSALKIVQRKLNQVLQAVYRPKSCVHGFTQDRSIITNAREHARKRLVLNVDIEQFFPSINFGRVRGMFIAVPYNLPVQAATVLAQICCHNNQLPQGAPTSPVVANMICGKLDSNLTALAKANKCWYTRYADDITFSTNLPRCPEAIARDICTPAGDSIQLGPELERVISLNGFQANKRKVRLQKRSGRQEVTGLTTNHFPNVRRKYVRQIRAMLYAWRKHGLPAAEAEFRSRYDAQHRRPGSSPISFVDVVAGKIGFLQMVRGPDASMVRHFWNQLAALDRRFERETLDREVPAEYRRYFDALWVLECEAESKQGTAFSLRGYGLVTCEHALLPGTVAFQPRTSGCRYPVRPERSVPGLDLAIAAMDAPLAPYLEPELVTPTRIGDRITLLGFPNYGSCDTGRVAEGRVVGIRAVHGTQRILIDTDIVGGNSGGPVLNASGRVIGVAVTGSKSREDADLNAAISIDALRFLRAPLAGEEEARH